MNYSRPCHIVQISQDQAVFFPERDCEPLSRQLSYGSELERIVPGSRMTLIVLTQDKAAKAVTRNNVVILPCTGGKLSGRMRIWNILKQLHNERPIDVITTQTVFDEAWVALVFAWLNGCRVVGQIHFDIFSDAARKMQFGFGVLGTIRCRTGLLLLNKFYGLRVVGKSIKEKIMNDRLHFRVEVLPVQVPLISGCETRHTEDRAVHKILFVGRLAREKNLQAWLQVAALIAQSNPNVEFHIIGDGPEKSMVLNMAAELGIAALIHLHGYVPNEQLPEHYRTARLFLLTSHYEGFGRVVAEALAFGTPVVAPRITGVEDIIRHNITGFLHETGDISGMAQSALRLLHNPQLAVAMGKEGHNDMLEKYAPAKLAGQWVAFLTDTVRTLPPQLILPRRRTWSRWRVIGFSKYTLLRSLEYEALRGLVLEGRTLDIGGGAKNSYYDLIEFRGTVESVNINPEMEPTLIADLNQPLPIESEVYDNVISLNTFEHICNDTLAIAESLRVLKRGGQFHFVMPFLYQIHGSPYDYHRHTATWWIDFLHSHGVDQANYIIEPLVWDRITSAYSFVGHGKLGVWLKRFVTLPAVIRDLSLRGQDRLPNQGIAHRTLDVTLGYYIKGIK